MKDILIAATLVFAGALFRLLPHPPNFAPIAALALFGGVVLPRGWSFLLPFGGMLLSDAIIGFHQPPVMAAVYASFFLVVLFGWWARRQEERGLAVFGASLAGSVLFFLITNFAVWVWGGLYPRTGEGLALSYLMGVPFFRNTLLGDLFYTGLFFGLYAAATWLVRHRAWFRHKQMLKNPRG